MDIHTGGHPPNAQPSTTNSRELRTHLLQWVDRICDRRYRTLPTPTAILAGQPEPLIRQAIAALREEQRGPSPAEWASHYGKLLLSCPQAELSQDQARLKFLLFCTDLDGIPATAIARACDRYRQEPSLDGKAKFFPQSGQIRGLCEHEAREAKKILCGLKEIERVLDAPPLPKPEATECISAVRAREVREALAKQAKLPR